MVMAPNHLILHMWDPPLLDQTHSHVTRYLLHRNQPKFKSNIIYKHCMELVIGCRKYNQIIVYQFLIRPVEGYDQNMTQKNVHTRLNGPGSGKI